MPLWLVFLSQFKGLLVIILLIGGLIAYFIGDYRDGIAAEYSPNIETLIFQDLDLNLLKKHREFGNVLTLKDRRRDLYKIQYKEDDLDSEV